MVFLFLLLLSTEKSYGYTTINGHPTPWISTDSPTFIASPKPSPNIGPYRTSDSLSKSPISLRRSSIWRRWTPTTKVEPPNHHVFGWEKLRLPDRCFVDFSVGNWKWNMVKPYSWSETILDCAPPFSCIKSWRQCELLLPYWAQLRNHPKFHRKHE